MIAEAKAIAKAVNRGTSMSTLKHTVLLTKVAIVTELLTEVSSLNKSIGIVKSKNKLACGLYKCPTENHKCLIGNCITAEMFLLLQHVPLSIGAVHVGQITASLFRTTLGTMLGTMANFRGAKR